MGRMMRYSASEKMASIRLVEESDMSVRRTLEELDINRSTFYNWYNKYSQYGYEGLTKQSTSPRRFWNKIPEQEKKRVVDLALEHPQKSPRELAWYITDTEKYYVSESSVYRILKANNLLTSPSYIVLTARDKFHTPTKRPNELWQTDFTYLKVIGWGWYYLGTILDDYSRYIITFKLCQSMKASEVKKLVDQAIKKTGVAKINVRYRPRLLSDNGSCYISDEFQKYLSQHGITHIRSAPLHPMTQGKIERYHRSMKNVINLQNYFFPGQLNKEIERFVKYYNNDRYHESLDNIKPVDVYYNQHKAVLRDRLSIKKRTMKKRRIINNASLWNYDEFTTESHLNF